MLNIFNKIRDKIRHGLLLRSFEWHLSDLLNKLGIEIVLYYWILEGFVDDNLLCGDVPKDCTFEFLGTEEMKIIGNIKERDDVNVEELLSRLKEGKKCFAVKYQGQIAAFTWFDFIGDSFTYRKIRLDNNEAYLFDMYTLKEFRGNNIAPLLRYQSYKILREMGRTKYYSVSELFNTPAIKFKKKLKANFISMHLDIKLFKKFHWNWKIKDCNIDLFRKSETMK